MKMDSLSLLGDMINILFCQSVLRVVAVVPMIAAVNEQHGAKAIDPRVVRPKDCSKNVLANTALKTPALQILRGRFDAGDLSRNSLAVLRTYDYIALCGLVVYRRNNLIPSADEHPSSLSIMAVGCDATPAENSS